MYCTKCGTITDEEICPNCGEQTVGLKEEGDDENVLWANESIAGMSKGGKMRDEWLETWLLGYIMGIATLKLLLSF